MKKLAILFSVFLLTSCAYQRTSNKDSKTKYIQGGEPVHIGITDKTSAVLGLSFVSPDEAGWRMDGSLWFKCYANQRK